MIRFAAVGTSAIMNVMQEAMRLTDGVTCQVIYSRSKERALAYAAQAGVPEGDDDLERICSRDDIDAVYIASPNYIHVQQALTALSHGKHVVVEKPASIDCEGIAKMEETAREHDVFFFEAITTIYTPNFRACKKVVQELGRIEKADLCYSHYSSKYDAYLRGENPNIFNPQMKAGALNDMGIYCIHGAVNLFGRPETVSYEPVLGPNGIDLEGTLLLQYPDFTCRIRAAKDRTLDNISTVQGERGLIRQSGPFNAFSDCEAQLDGKPVQVDVQPEENRMLYELAAFRDAIDSHDEAFYRQMLEQSRTASWILEEAHK